MANNFINVNKTNNGLIEHKMRPRHTTLRPRHTTLEINVLACDRHTYVAGLNKSGLIGKVFPLSHVKGGE